MRLHEYASESTWSEKIIITATYDYLVSTKISDWQAFEWIITSLLAGHRI